jgi:CRISPR-associated protein Cas1
MFKRRLFIKVKHNTLPQIKEKYPFIYLEHGRLEVDDSSIKWIDCDCSILRIPCATINAILLGPGTSITHEAVKTITSSNCLICWVGEDSLLFYAYGQSPTADSKNLRKQISLATDKKSAAEVARKMFLKRFPKTDIENKTIKEIMGMEGYRVRELYETLANKYGIGWSGRQYQPGKFELSDTTNQYLTASNSMLYSIISAAIYSMGYSPYIGFIHSGSPLPFVYDIADLYKERLCIDTAFFLTHKMGGRYDREVLISEFIERTIQEELLEKIGDELKSICS